MNDSGWVIMYMTLESDSCVHRIPFEYWWALVVTLHSPKDLFYRQIAEPIDFKDPYYLWIRMETALILRRCYVYLAIDDHQDETLVDICYTNHL